jgi:hypothetical protein
MTDVHARGSSPQRVLGNPRMPFQPRVHLGFLPFVLVGWYLLRPPTLGAALTSCSWFFYA